MLVKTATAGKTEVMIVAAQYHHIVTRGVGKGLNNLVSFSKQMRKLEFRGNFFSLKLSNVSYGPHLESRG